MLEGIITITFRSGENVHPVWLHRSNGHSLSRKIAVEVLALPIPGPNRASFCPPMPEVVSGPRRKHVESIGLWRDGGDSFGGQIRTRRQWQWANPGVTIPVPPPGRVTSASGEDI